MNMLNLESSFLKKMRWDYCVKKRSFILKYLGVQTKRFLNDITLIFLFSVHFPPQNFLEKNPFVENHHN